MNVPCSISLYDLFFSFSLISYAFEMFEHSLLDDGLSSRTVQLMGNTLTSMLFGRLSKHFLRRYQVLVHLICWLLLFQIFARNRQQLRLHSHIMTYFFEESRIMLWRKVTKPPFLQDKACCKSKCAPHAHFSGSRVN